MVTFPDAANFYFASGFAEISFTVFIAEFASFAGSGVERFTGFAVCTAAAKFFDGHD